jgi:hypothetical protein
MEGNTFEALFWVMRFHIGFHMGIANLHKYLALKLKFGRMISTRADPSTPHMTKTMIFEVLINAFDFVIEKSRARAHLASQSYEKWNQDSFSVTI